MKSSAGKQRQEAVDSIVYLRIKRAWATEMNRLTGGLSASRLRLCLIIFVLLGTGCFMYTVLQGFSGQSHDSIGREGITVIKNGYRFDVDGKRFFDLPIRPDRKPTVLSSYIDSVIKSSPAIDLHQADRLGAEELYSIYGAETSTTNDNKFNYGK